MATVKRIEIRLPDGKPFDLQIKCNSDGEFSASLPSQCVVVLGYAHVKGDSLKKCREAFDQALLSFKEASTMTRKVLIYSVKKNHWNSKEGVSLNFKAGVFSEITTTSTAGRKVSFELLDSQIGKGLGHYMQASITGGYISDGAKLIPWSKERESFFAKLGETIERIKGSLESLDETDLAMELADGGSKFVLLTSK